jgi:hypothetical protein
MRSMRGLYVIRGGSGKPAISTRPARADGEDPAPDDGRLGTLVVDFSRFDTWYEIDSFWEGRFLEKINRGAFRSTIKRHGDRVKVLFNHGFDFHIGDKVLGVPEVLEERDESPHLEAGLLDTSYNRDLEPGLRAGAYGSSFMFEVTAEKWSHEPEKSEQNPEGLPERTITAVNLFEAGPVTWPANPDATASLRSGIDWLVSAVAERDQGRYDELVRSFEAFRAYHGLRRAEDAPAPPVGKPEPETLAAGDPARHVDGVSAAARARRLQLIDVGRR